MANVPNNGKKNDYAERLKRQRTASTIKFYIVAIVLGAVLGLAYIQRATIISVYNSVLGPPPPPPAAPVPVTPPPAPKIIETKVVEAPKKNVDAAPSVPKPQANIIREPAVSPAEENKARQLIAEGKTLMESFDLATAGKRFDEAAKLKIGTALKEDAQTWKQKTDTFQSAIKHIPFSEYSRGENAVTVETIAGDEWRGLKLKEDDSTIYLQAVSDSNPAAEGIQKFQIPRAEIKRITPVSLAKRKGDFSEMVLSAESATTISHSSDYYDLVYLSKRLGLGKECMMYLNRAFDGGPNHAPDPNVGDTFRKVVVRRSIGRATLMMAGNRRTQVELELKKLRDTLPGFAPADEEIAAFRSQVMDKVKADFQPSVVVTERKLETKKAAPVTQVEKPKAKAPEPEESVVITTGTGPVGNGASARFVDAGNSKFDKGMSIIRTYTVGVGGNKNKNNEILQQAKVMLLDAIDSYEEALKVEPSNKGVRDRQQTASQMVYFCNKNLIL